MLQKINSKEAKFHFSKKLGQNFIFDQNLLNAICSDALITKQSTVLEIGAGSGSLTRTLALTAKNVVSYEIDKSLKSTLDENLNQFSNVTVIYEDILKQNLSFLENQLQNPYTLVANLPYYITTPILFFFLKEAKNLEKMVVMVQKEVADRIVAKPSSKDYGILSVIIQAVSNVKITRLVNRHLFTPVPNVDSAVVVITMQKNNYKFANFDFFQTVVKQAFSMRRKTLLNNLLSAFELSKNDLLNLLDQLSLSHDIRAEALDVSTLVELSNKLYAQINL